MNQYQSLSTDPSARIVMLMMTYLPIRILMLMMASKQHILDEATHLCCVLIAYVLTVITRISRDNRVYFGLRVTVCCVLIAYVLIVIFRFESAYFALRGTALIWNRWVINDAVVRQAYHSSVVTATAKILREIHEGCQSHMDGVNEAVDKRNSLLLQMRDLTSPLGQLIAHLLKSAGITVEDGLKKNARKRYNLDYNKITQEAQRNQVSFKYQKLHIY